MAVEGSSSKVSHQGTLFDTIELLIIVSIFLHSFLRQNIKTCNKRNKKYSFYRKGWCFIFIDPLKCDLRFYEFSSRPPFCYAWEQRSQACHAALLLPTFHFKIWQVEIIGFFLNKGMQPAGTGTYADIFNFKWDSFMTITSKHLKLVLYIVLNREIPTTENHIFR